MLKAAGQKEAEQERHSDTAHVRNVALNYVPKAIDGRGKALGPETAMTAKIK